MLNRKVSICVGVTTFCAEMLNVSISALSKLQTRFLLVVCNDNPCVNLTARQIRRLGYRGPLHIINNAENMGTLGARLTIIDYISGLKNIPEWTVFCDDDDMLVNLDIPSASSDIFAVIQNRLVIRHRVCDLVRTMLAPTDCVPDGDNIVLEKPYVGFTGMLIRSRLLIALKTLLAGVLSQIADVDNSVEYRTPIDAMMWSAVNKYARYINQNALPVYMDRVNYIAVKLDSGSVKYGRVAVPARNIAEHYSRVLAQYDKILDDALKSWELNKKEKTNDI